ncbi:MarR family transcriptional regulator [Pararhodobacter marinus]|nr:MarR family transcriptional regulator [Pararhodobacter marinus]
MVTSVAHTAAALPADADAETHPSQEKSSDTNYYERSLTVALLRARESTMRRFKKYVDERDLSLPQWRVLRALAEGEPLDAGTLCERCVILPPSLTRILRALAERGLTRQVDCADARRHMVALSDKGQALFDELVGASENSRREIYDAFGPEKMALLLDLLNELREITEALPEPD